MSWWSNAPFCLAFLAVSVFFAPSPTGQEADISRRSLLPSLSVRGTSCHDRLHFPIIEESTGFPKLAGETFIAVVIAQDSTLAATN
jgi:hypothetical protein